MLKMMEDEIVIYCLQRDKAIIKELLNDCSEEFERITGERLEEKKSCKLWIDDSKFLEERVIPNLDEVKLEDINSEHENKVKIAHDKDDLSCIGGVVLKDKTKKIICKNTLDLRIEMAFNLLLPEIRRKCFI